MSKLEPKDIQKIYIHRELSSHVLPTFEDNYFDMIYIDGNHAREYVLEDAVHSFRKLRPGGWLIMDDAHDKDVLDGLQAFYQCFKHKLKEPKARLTQLFIQKLD